MAHRGHATITLALMSVLAGCELVGPTAIKNGRLDYNQVIHETSMQQVLKNIVNVKNHEPTTFFDVTEVDSVVIAQAQVSGQVGGIGALTKSGPGANGQVTGSLEYEEEPTIRYQPLLGQALVQQISTPINVDSLAYLYDSDWFIGPILNLAADRLTPRYDDYYSALHAIIKLDYYGALVLSAEKSDLTSKADDKQQMQKDTKANVYVTQNNQQNADTGSNNALVLYLQPDSIDIVPISARFQMTPKRGSEKTARREH